METIKKSVGVKCRELRKRAGFSSVELAAEAMEVHPNTVGELERGANWISPEMLDKMASLYKAPMAAFFPGFSESVEPTPQEALEVLQRAINNTPKAPENSLVAELLRVTSAMDENKLRYIIKLARARSGDDSVLSDSLDLSEKNRRLKT